MIMDLKSKTEQFWDRIPDGWQFIPFEVIPTGSELFCPSKAPNDFDLFGRATFDDYVGLVEDGWVICGSMANEDVRGAVKFVSLRKDLINVICCFTDEFFSRFRKATLICLLSDPEDIQHKQDRIDIFRSILYPEESK